MFSKEVVKKYTVFISFVDYQMCLTHGIICLSKVGLDLRLRPRLEMFHKLELRSMKGGDPELKKSINSLLWSTGVQFISL